MGMTRPSRGPASGYERLNCAACYKRWPSSFKAGLLRHERSRVEAGPPLTYDCDRFEMSEDRRVELRPAFASEYFHHALMRSRWLMRARGRHRVVTVGHADDSGTQRNLFA